MVRIVPRDELDVLILALVLFLLSIAALPFITHNGEGKTTLNGTTVVMVNNWTVPVCQATLDISLGNDEEVLCIKGHSGGYYQYETGTMVLATNRSVYRTISYCTHEFVHKDAGGRDNSEHHDIIDGRWGDRIDFWEWDRRCLPLIWRRGKPAPDFDLNPHPNN